MMKFLFIAAVACFLLGIGYSNAYQERKKIAYDDKCNNYYVWSTSCTVVGIVLIIVVVGMLVFHMS